MTEFTPTLSVRARLGAALAATLCASLTWAAVADAAYYRSQRTNDAGLTILFAFKVRDGRIVFEKVKAPQACGPGRAGQYINGAGPASISVNPRTGRFRDTNKVGRINDVLEGVVGPRAIVGRFRSNGDCHTGTSENPWLRFKAVRLPDRGW